MIFHPKIRYIAYKYGFPFELFRQQLRLLVTRCNCLILEARGDRISVAHGHATQNSLALVVACQCLTLGIHHTDSVEDYVVHRSLLRAQDDALAIPEQRVQFVKNLASELNCLIEGSIFLCNTCSQFWMRVFS